MHKKTFLFKAAVHRHSLWQSNWNHYVKSLARNKEANIPVRMHDMQMLYDRKTCLKSDCDEG